MKDNGSCIVAGVHWNHLPCLLPQHGAGKKRERRIRLEDWQRKLVDRAPWSLLRGLIWSDGCSFINRTGRYEYLSYACSNRSPDLIELFAETCERVGVPCRIYPPRADRPVGMVRINRRVGVELLDRHVGRKAR